MSSYALGDATTPMDAISGTASRPMSAQSSRNASARSAWRSVLNRRKSGRNSQSKLESTFSNTNASMAAKWHGHHRGVRRGRETARQRSLVDEKLRLGRARVRGHPTARRVAGRVRAWPAALHLIRMSEHSAQWLSGRQCSPSPREKTGRE